MRNGASCALLPHATYADWSGIDAALMKALARPVSPPIIPVSVFAAYAGRPLARKTGLRPGLQVALIRPPPEFLPALGALPEGVDVRQGRPTGADLVIWFARTTAELERKVAALSANLGRGVVWIAWPKGGTAARGDLTQQVVRARGLAASLVDYKICSIDSSWSALLLKRR